jgi:hypothetical protein
MATFCLLPEQVKKLQQALKDTTPDKLNDMTSKERHDFFSQHVGEQNAGQVNALLESKLLLKNQQKGMMAWAKKVLENKPAAQRDMVSRIQKMDKILNPAEEKAFLNDLADHKLGIGITFEEAKTLSEFSQNVAELKDKAKGTKDGSSQKLEYGSALVLYKKYLGELKLGAEKLSFKEWIKSPRAVIKSVASAAKSAVATLDNSFFGRQGIKMLYTNPTIWGKAFIKSWGDIGRALKGVDSIDLVKADIWSRDRALNGDYARSKTDIGISTEEAFPSQVWEKVPLLNRVFKASEQAYNGAALRMRADYADRVFKLAEDQGINLKDKVQIESIGKLVNSMTGRGSIGRLESIGGEVNAAFFSIKFLKSNFDVLTAHQFDRTMSSFAKKQAAKNLTKIVLSTSAVLTLANILWPGSVETDPRSSDFGKIKIGNTKFDITGGMSSLVVLATRGSLAIAEALGADVAFTKSSSGVLQKNTGEFGLQTGLDVVEQFWEGKLSPTAGAVRDMLKGQTFSGEKPTPTVLLKNMFIPIPIQTLQTLLKDPNSANDVLSMIADGLGISVSESYTGTTDWNTSSSKELQQFKEKVGKDKFNQANQDFNTLYVERLKKLQSDPTYQKLSEDDKAKQITKLKDVVKGEIYRKYSFTYIEPRPTRPVNIRL